MVKLSACVVLFPLFLVELQFDKAGADGTKKNGKANAGGGEGPPAEGAKEKWKKKDVRDYTDADVERLYEQWEDGDEDPLEEDELPEWKRPAPQIDLTKLDLNDPEAVLRQSKQGRTLMMFATVSGNPTEKETETITQLWHGSLFNAHYDIQRHVVGENRVLFVLKDGAMAWPIKDFLVQQDRCEVVTIEGKDYKGRGSPDYKAPAEDKKSAKKKKGDKNDGKEKKKKADEKKQKEKKAKRDDL